MDKSLSSGVRATVKTDDVVQVRTGYPVYRILIHIYSDIPDKNMLIKNYYVWMTEDFASDSLHLKKVPDDNDYALAALQELSGRYLAKPEGKIPSENGLDCSNEHGVVTLNNAENYVHPVEKEA